MEGANYAFMNLECLSKLLHSLSSYGEFTQADNVYSELVKITREKGKTYPNLATIYNEFSIYHFDKCNYQDSYTWAMEAVKLLTTSFPPKLTIDMWRQASKSCAVKLEFGKAEML